MSGRKRWTLSAEFVACVTLVGGVGAGSAERLADSCISAQQYVALDGATVGLGQDGLPALGSYERISPDGRFILRSYSGAQLGKVSLIELPWLDGEVLKAYPTPLSNEAFPVQGTWRYLVDVNGDHYRFLDVYRQGRQAKPLFRGGMTGFYAAASEMSLEASVQERGGFLAEEPARKIHLRSLSWPQDADPDSQGVGPLQLMNLEILDDGQSARIVRKQGPQFICDGRVATDGNAYALPMLSVRGDEFSAIAQAPRIGQPSMRVYRLASLANSVDHSCDLVADLGLTVSKAVFGFARTGESAWLAYSDLGNVYVYDRTLGVSFRLDHGKSRVLASAFPGLTRDGRVIYGASWRECADDAKCPEKNGYVVIDPYQSTAYRAYWRQLGQRPPQSCIRRQTVQDERLRFARLHHLTP